MKLLKLTVLALAAAVAIGLCLFASGCASFATNTYRAEQAAVNLAFGAYTGYTQGLASGVIKVDAGTSNDIRAARLKFAASVGTLEALRAAYTTNAAVKGQITGLLTTISEQASNVVWTIQFVKGK